MAEQKKKTDEHASIEYREWEKAQEWEKSYWDRFVKRQDGILNLGLLKKYVKRIFHGKSEERSNYWWQEKFDQYRFLPRQLDNVIEFGCGPFTNLRLIIDGIDCKHVVASDPLAKHYVTYRGHYLANKYKTRQWLIDDHAMEDDFYADNVFDLAVCINVLEHVRDWEACMRNFLRVIKPGGIAIFGQELTSDEIVESTKVIREETGTDIGHPHKFDTCEMMRVFFKDFDPIIDKECPREEVRLQKWNSGAWVYAGRKRGA
jgi:2-polyprenyl-3-methyl-5-hydroxy-6-metoxy-1,4-benzoquinol methylase